MTFMWPDPISLVTDVVTFIGVPTLGVTTWRFYQEYRKEQAERTVIKSVSQGCLEFYDYQERVVINLVELDRVAASPRPGDLVMLPGETREGANRGGGDYEVERVIFTFLEEPEIDQPCSAIPSKVIAYVRRREL